MKKILVHALLDSLNSAKEKFSLKKHESLLRELVFFDIEDPIEQFKIISLIASIEASKDKKKLEKELELISSAIKESCQLDEGNNQYSKNDFINNIISKNKKKY